MIALVENSSQITEFGGKFKVAVIDVDGTTSTNDTITVDEMSVVIGAVATLKAAHTADCCGVRATATGTTNVITCSLAEGDGSVCTQNPLDFVVFAIGY